MLQKGFPVTINYTFLSETKLGRVFLAHPTSDGSLRWTGTNYNSIKEDTAGVREKSARLLSKMMLRVYFLKKTQ